MSVTTLKKREYYSLTEYYSYTLNIILTYFSSLLKEYLLANKDAFYANATKIKDHGIVKQEYIFETLTLSIIHVDDLERF